MKDFIFCYSKVELDARQKTADVFKYLYGDSATIISNKGKNWVFIGVQIEDALESSTDKLNGVEQLIGQPLTLKNKPINASELKSIIDNSKTIEVDGDYVYFQYNNESKKIKIVSSKLGLLPCYYIVTDDYCIVSSRILLIKKIIADLSVNLGAVAQFCLYNYIITDRTFFKNVFDMPSGSVLNIDIAKNKVETIQYWSIENELVENPYSFKNSKVLLNTTLDSIIKEKINEKRKIGLSLTGGWDGRLLLGYASKYKKKEDIQLYSFGTIHSPDVFVPKENARNIGYNYLHIDLGDSNYEENKIKFAIDTVIKSDGMRSFKRGHYLYAMSFLRKDIDFIISGIGGSNLIKSGKIQSSNVINSFVLELIYASDYKEVIRKHYDYLKKNYSEIFDNLEYSEFQKSFECKRFLNLYLKYKSSRRRLISFLLSDIERKYFGYELMSYRPLVNNYSPFFDMQFIRILAKTSYFGAYDLNSSKFAPIRNARLYAKLVSINFPLLAKQKTDRGFSLFDLLYPYRVSFMKDYLNIKKYSRDKNKDFFNNRDLESSIVDSYGFPVLANQKHKSEVISNFLTFKIFQQA